MWSKNSNDSRENLKRLKNLVLSQFEKEGLALTKYNTVLDVHYTKNNIAIFTGTENNYDDEGSGDTYHYIVNDNFTDLREPVEGDEFYLNAAGLSEDPSCRHLFNGYSKYFNLSIPFNKLNELEIKLNVTNEILNHLKEVVKTEIVENSGTKKFPIDINESLQELRLKFNNKELSIFNTDEKGVAVQIKPILNDEDFDLDDLETILDNEIEVLKGKEEANLKFGKTFIWVEPRELENGFEIDVIKNNKDLNTLIKSFELTKKELMMDIARKTINIMDKQTTPSFESSDISYDDYELATEYINDPCIHRHRISTLNEIAIEQFSNCHSDVVEELLESTNYLNKVVDKSGSEIIWVKSDLPVHALKEVIETSSGKYYHDFTEDEDGYVTYEGFETSEYGKYRMKQRSERLGRSLANIKQKPQDNKLSNKKVNSLSQ